MDKWTPTTEEKKIIKSERERMLSDGIDGREIMRLTTGENRKKLLIEYHQEHGLDYNPSWTDEKELQKSTEGKPGNRHMKSATKEKKNVNTSNTIIEELPPKKGFYSHKEYHDTDFSMIPDRYNQYAYDYAITLGDDGEKKLTNKEGNYFTGLIKYISMKENYGEELYSSVDNLCDVWNAYEYLTYRYNQKPILEEYAMLIGIRRSTLYDWMNGGHRQDRGERVSCTRSDAIKRMQESCRIGRYKSAAAGNIGGIFLSKAVDGLVETAPAQVYNPVQAQNNMEIASKMGLLLSDNSVNAIVDNQNRIV